MTASGRYSLPLENMRTLLANSAAFRSLVGAADVTAAKAAIVINEAEMTNNNGTARTRPWAIIGFNEFKLKRVSTTGWRASGPIQVIIETTMPSGDQSNWPAALVTWQNAIGAIVDQMATLVTGTGEYLDVNELSVDQCGIADEIDHNGNTILGAALTVDWSGV